MSGVSEQDRKKPLHRDFGGWRESGRNSENKTTLPIPSDPKGKFPPWKSWLFDASEVNISKVFPPDCKQMSHALKARWKAG